MEAGWRALATNFEGMGDSPSPGTRILERVQLEVWWGAPENRKTMLVTGYRSVQMKAEDMGAFGQMSLEPPK
jgi:hypothetical protein